MKMTKLKKAKLKPRFDVVFLQQLVEDKISCVYIETQKYHLALHPFHLNDVNQSIKDVLNVDLLKYNLKFGGIVVGYKNIKLLSDLGAIIDDSCYVHIDIEADFFIFKPEIGKTLQAVVNKKSKDHIGCLVHTLFNVSIPKHGKGWIGDTLELTSEIQLEITFTDFDGKLPYIKGKIVSILSQPDSALYSQKPTKIRFDEYENVETEIIEKIKSPKKDKKQKKNDLINNNIEYCNGSEIDPETPKRKRKRSVKVEETDHIAEENDSEVLSPKKKRKKSHKSQTEETNILEETNAVLEQIKLEEITKRKRKKMIKIEKGADELDWEQPSPKKEKKTKKHKIENDKIDANLSELIDLNQLFKTHQVNLS